MDIAEKIRALAKRNLKEVIAIRRHLHSEPELSFAEVKTHEYLHSLLKKLPCNSLNKVTETGLVGKLSGKEPGKTIALRADMDALPINELNDVPYKSKTERVMHACGHDVHMASLIGTAMILGELRDSWNGTIELIFQPGEEKLPGGASLMIKAGVLENPPPDAVIGQHVFPSLQAGKAGFLAGPYMASCDEIYMTVKGKGGHAAMRSSYINPILIASRILTELESKFMLKPENDIPTVLAFGKIECMGATNVIPAEVKLAGTFRTMNEEWRAKAHEMIHKMVSQIASEMGGTCELRIDKGYPALVNNERVTGYARKAAEEYLGKENVITLDKSMTSEDFSFYSLVRPACFYRLGTGNKERGITSGVHTPTFDIDENALETGMGLMAYIAYCNLMKLG